MLPVKPLFFLFVFMKNIARLTAELWKCPQLVDDAKFASFVEHIINKCEIKPSLMYHALYYIQLLSSRVPQPRSPSSAYRILVSALILADISLNDKCRLIRTWSAVTGFTTKEIIYIRKEIMELLEYKLHIDSTSFEQWVKEVAVFLEEGQPPSSISPDNLLYGISAVHSSNIRIKSPI
jgi:hypothetical protein